MNLLILLYFFGSLLFISGVHLAILHLHASKRMIIAAVCAFVVLIGIFMIGSNLQQFIIGRIVTGILIVSMAWIIAKIADGTILQRIQIILAAITAACAVAVSMVEYGRLATELTTVPHLSPAELMMLANAEPPTAKVFMLVLVLILSAVAFAGSMFVFARLKGYLDPIPSIKQKPVYIALLASILFMTIYLVTKSDEEHITRFYMLLLLAFLLGAFVVLQTRKEDLPLAMPLFILLIGLAIVCVGLLLSKPLLIPGFLLIAKALLQVNQQSKLSYKRIWSSLVNGVKRS